MHPDRKLVDAAMRQAAFDQVRRLCDLRSTVDAKQLALGFVWQGRRFPLVNPQRGIFKPKEMPYLLSIRSVLPRPGGAARYEDQATAHQAIYRGDEAVTYAFMGTDPEAADNRWLREAAADGIPVIYFLGVGRGRYQAIMPAFLHAWDPVTLTVRVAFSADEAQTGMQFPDAPERRYAMRLVKQRLHQATFRERLIEAYRGRCAVSGLPEPRLIDAAHIIPDADEVLGQPLIVNGLPLSKIHHAAFDAHLIGIDADYRVHVSDALLEKHDGPLLEHGIKGLAGNTILRPTHREHYPDRDRLAARFEIFRKAA